MPGLFFPADSAFLPIKAIFAGVLLILGTATAAEVPKNLRVCGDEDEWPPFTYFQRIDGKKTAVVTGYNVDFLNELLAASGRTASYTLLPWQRCIVESQGGAYDIVLDGIKSPERQKQFLFPDSHYRLTPVLLHRSSLTKAEIAQPDFWSKLNVCGQMGYTYSLKGSSLEKTRIQFAAKTFDAAIQMVISKRCDALIHDLEVLVGHAQIGRKNVLDDKRLGYIRLNLPWQKTNFHLMVSRAKPYQKELLEIIHKGVAERNQSGQGKKLLRKYVPEG